MKSKNLISLTLACVFFVLGISGILMYIKFKPHPVEMAHTIFGLMFLGFAVFHISNNWGSLKSYSKDRVSRSWKKELAVALSIAGLVLILALTEVLEPVAEFGRIFAAKRPPAARAVSFQEKTTLDSTNGRALTLILQKKSSEMAEPLKVELADSTGKILGTLYEDVRTEEDIENNRPLLNLILTTKVSAVAPFRLLVSAGSKKDETNITSLQPGVIVIAPKEGSPLERGFIELK